MQRETLSKTCRDYSHPENTAAIPEQFLSHPCPAPSPQGTDPSWVGAVGEQPPRSRENPEPALQGRDFSPQTSTEHVQAERLEMFIKWPSLAGKRSESHSPAKSQQHGGARAAQIGRYLTVSRQAKPFFLFPENWWCQSHISHMPYTHTCINAPKESSTAAEISTLFCERWVCPDLQQAPGKFYISDPPIIITENPTIVETPSRNTLKSISTIFAHVPPIKKTFVPVWPWVCVCFGFGFFSF